MFEKLLKLKPPRRHRVAHRVAHRWEPCEIGGIVEILRSQNVSDDDVVQKAWDRGLRGGLARIGRALTLGSAYG
jgi:hypothetical protein